MSSPDYNSPSLGDTKHEGKRGDEHNSPYSAPQPRFRKHREYKTYNYDPLPSQRGTIRLLNLFSSEKFDAGVLCELITPKDKEKALYPYEALSWCWGSAAKTDYIRIQRSQKTYTKYVSPNLVAALKALRYPDRSRYLWIDMICIDQDNLDEKNHQVEMMNVIYGNAVRVCIWLGEANDSSRMALQFIKKEVSHLQSFDTLCDSKDASKKWVALLDLMQRPWFSRRWVVQELALAQKAIIYCGNDRITWKKFAIAVELFVEVETATHRLSEVMKKDRQYQYIPSYFEFVSALGASLLVDATERLFRDYQEERQLESDSESRIYSEMGLSSGSDSELNPDSSDSDASNSGASISHHIRRGAPAIQKTRIQPLLSLEYLVSSLTIFDTSMPHDTIYALLAIAKDTTPRAVAVSGINTSGQAQDGLEIYQQRKSYNVDYNLPYVDVCKDFILFSIERSLQVDRSRALDVVCRPWAIEERKLRKIREEKKAAKEKREREIKREREREKRHPSRTSRRKSRHQNVEDDSNNAVDNEMAITGGSQNIDEEDNDLPLPSWIPQLSCAPYAMAQRPGLAGPKMSRINADPLVGLPSLTQRNYSAAETKGVDMKVLKFRKRAKLGHFSMYIRGFILDTIEVVEQVARNGQIPQEWAELGGWEGARGHPPDAFWRTLVANRGKDGKNPPVYYSRACQESFKKGGLESGAVDTTALIDYERNSVVAQFCRRVQAVTWNRAISKTEKGRLALVGKDVDKGDLVCILYGCSVPVILRKSKVKGPEIFEKEMVEELRFVANAVGQRYKQYAARKQRHEARKHSGMILLCRQWLKATDWLQVRKTSRDDLPPIESLREALRSFSEWRSSLRRKAWLERERTINSEAGESRKNGKIGPKLDKPVRRSTLEENGAQSRRRNSKSHAHPCISSTGFGANRGTITEVAREHVSTTRKKPESIDWWEFELALAAGRRWKKIVKLRKEERINFALERVDIDWKKKKNDEFLAFKNKRQEQKMWRTAESKYDTDSPAVKPSVKGTPTAIAPLPAPQENDLDSAQIETKIRPSWSRNNEPIEKLSHEDGKINYRQYKENLRSRLGEDGQYSYQLLGECYIHGMMDGEAMSYQNKGNEGDEDVVHSRVFEIR